MQFRRYVTSLTTVLLLVAALGAQGPKAPKPLVCGTSPAMQRQEVFLHRQAMGRRAALLRAGRNSISQSGGVLDLQRTLTNVSNDILLMSRDGGVTIPRNPFPVSLLAKTLKFVPANASASAYRVEQPADGAFREDAVQAPAINLIQPGQPSSFTDDDYREFDLPFPFPFYGKTYNKVIVHSNGFVGFEEASPAGNRLNYTEFLGGPPKIMAAGIDLDPPAGEQGVAGIWVFITDSEAIVSYVKVPEFLNSGNLVDMQIRLTTDGSISFLHRRGPQGLYVMGITPGRNLSTGELIDFTNPPAGEIGGAIAEIFSDTDSGEIDIARAAQVFFQAQPDDYDYVIFFNNQNIMAGPTALAYEITVRNSVRGIGDSETDYSEFFGSTGRLQAVLNMGPLQMYPSSPTEIVPNATTMEYTSVGLLAHEVGHRFLAYTLLQEPGQSTFTPNLLGRALAHWSFNFNADGSFMEGSTVRSTGKVDEFITEAPSVRYSQLDRYLMGLIGLEKVGAKLPTGEEQQLYYVDAATTRARAPRRGVQLIGPARNFNIYDVIAANGFRVPDHTVSQKRFRLAFVLITADGTAPDADIQKLNAIRTAFETFFYEQTGQLAIVDTALRPGLSADLHPAAGMLPGTQGQMVVRRKTATSSPVALTISASGDAATVPGSAEIPANATSVSIPITAVNAGVSAITISAADGSYLPDTVNLAVRNAGELQLDVLSGTRYQASANSETTTPVRVRVLDSNRLPYQGVEVRLDPTSGGSASPSPAVTDANGEASFTWTVGNASMNQAVVYLAASRGNTELALVAVESLVPSVAAATNGASFTPGLSPGSIGTLFGVSMAGGKTDAPTSQPLPLELAGVSVRVNGIACQLLYVSDLQINLVVPQSLTGAVAIIVVTTPDGSSNAFEAPLLTHDPAIFFTSGTNLGAVLRSGTGQKTDVAPALPGGFVEIFATGLGPLVSPRRGVLVTESTVTATINGGAPLTVDYSGIAPGFVGLYQVNLKIPDGLAPGSYLLRLQVNGKESNAVNIFVGAAGASASGWIDTAEFKH